MIVVYCVLWGAVGWLFFEHVIGVCACAVLGLLSMRQWHQARIRKREQRYAVQFEQLLLSLCMSLQAGRSIHNAFCVAEEDVRAFSLGKRSSFVVQIEQINHKVRNGVPIERALHEAHIPIAHWADWVDVFVGCTRSGADIVHVMRHTSRSMSEHMAREREMAVALAAKAFEAKILGILPFVLIALFRFGSPAYMDVLYDGVGRVVMAGCLGVLILARIWAARIMTPIALRSIKQRHHPCPAWAKNMLVRLGVSRLLITRAPAIVRQCQLLDADNADAALGWVAHGMMYWLIGVCALGTIAMTGDVLLIGACAVLACAWPCVWVLDVTRRARMRAQCLVAPLPAFVHKISLLLAAGDPLHVAWMRASASKNGALLYVYAAKATGLFAQSMPFPRALEHFSRWCGVSDVHAFVSTLMMHYQRGGESFANALGEYVWTLSDRQANAVRQRGEEASTALLFPMLCMLIAVLVTMATPAVLTMNALGA
jgi:tight adherence protein B